MLQLFITSLSRLHHQNMELPLAHGVVSNELLVPRVIEELLEINIRQFTSRTLRYHWSLLS